jgi:predicted phage terminase large subunit-like protein
VRQTAALDGVGVPILFELEGGAAGKANADHLQRQVLPGYSVTPIPASGSKVERARPLASAMEAGNVRMVEGPWNAELVAEMRNFPNSRHDDQVDAIAQAVIHLGQSALFYIR